MAKLEDPAPDLVRKDGFFKDQGLIEARPSRQVRLLQRQRLEWLCA